jgi:hypothetical protein
MNRTWPLVTYETMAWECVWLKLIMCGRRGAEPDFSTQKRWAVRPRSMISGTVLVAAAPVRARPW